ncbi:probable palmitoyltransferase ZDHHC11 [Lates japonicus]|uniref:Probable palmitoyltransferase ZDHHC11 n=1 Tax=Lates japonicus TaxID=270547 RepID=A0AAD3MZQ5_LATJO|nr:probable palmitoyltransferase ZDHHC11 [Lates japonicus]
MNSWVCEETVVHMRSRTASFLALLRLLEMSGWWWPPQVFQVVAVVGVTATCDGQFGIYIPLLPLPWNHALFFYKGIALYDCHKDAAPKKLETDMKQEKLLMQDPRPGPGRRKDARADRLFTSAPLSAEHISLE